VTRTFDTLHGAWNGDAMNQREFETQVLQLWTGTRIPLSLVNLQVMTSVPRTKLQKWLDAQVASGVLELDSDADGNFLWKVVGTARSPSGVSSLAEWQKLQALRGQVPAVRAAGGLPTTGGVHDEKSVIASGALSLFLGPLGWLYAAPVADAVGGILIVTVLNMLLPTFLFFWVMGLVQPLSALMAMLYAWQYNKNGTRTSIKDMGKEDLPRKLLP